MGEIRNLVKRADGDGFFTHNSLVACHIGTVMMMVSLANIAAAINLMQSRSHRASNQAFINTLVAGCGGAIGTFALQNLYLYLIWKEEERVAQELTFENERDNERRKAFRNLRKKTHFMNTYSRIDTFLIDRGIICGIVSISVGPSSFYPMTALLNGIFAGMLYVLSLKMYHTVKLDDTLHVS
jgi:ammonia channel protein AmtB